MSDDPSFEVPARPERRYPPSGGVEYRGRTVFRLTPVPGRTTGQLDDLLAAVMDADRYVLGDFFDLPAPAYLVHDEVAGTSFRVVVRDGRIELHVLPHTDAGALEELYRRLGDVGEVGWSVTRDTEPA